MYLIQPTNNQPDTQVRSISGHIPVYIIWYYIDCLYAELSLHWLVEDSSAHIWAIEFSTMHGRFCVNCGTIRENTTSIRIIYIDQLQL